MVDRFLSKSGCITQDYLNDRMKFQLLATTALYVAIKVNEQVVFSSDMVAEITRVYSVQDIEGMELTLLQGLEWRLNTPTSTDLATSILSLLLPCVDLEESTWGCILDEVKYYTVHVVRDYYFTTQLTSTAALAAIFNAFAQVGVLQDRQDVNVWTALLLVVAGKHFAPPQELIAAMRRLNSLVERDGPREEATVVSDTSSSSLEAEASVVSVSSSEEDISVDVDETSWSLEASSSFNVSCPSIHASVMSASSEEDVSGVDETSWNLEDRSSFNASCPSIHASVMSTSSEEDISDVISWNLEDRYSFNISCPSIHASAVSGFRRPKHLHCRRRSSTCS